VRKGGTFLQIGIYSPRPSLLAEGRETVEEFNSSACLDLTLRCCDSYEELSRMASALPLDILFYDMESGGHVQEELRRLCQTIPNCRIVLLSDSERHAVFGYALRAAGYLTTPLDREEFLAQLISLIREKLRAKEQFLPLKVNGVWSQLSMKHITYVESAGHSLIFHLEDSRRLKVQSCFKDYQNLLDLNPDYFRCHKSYVVNMSFVKNWSLTAFTLKNGEEINISRPYRQAARSMYACYVTRPLPQKAPQLEGPRH